jgi:hypothetical protein
MGFKLFVGLRRLFNPKLLRKHKARLCLPPLNKSLQEFFKRTRLDKTSFDM